MKQSIPPPKRMFTGLFYFTIAIILTLTITSGYGELYHYETKEFEVTLDHFDVAVNTTFKIRYLFNDTYVDKQSEKSPLFFYTGNEGDIEFFAQNTGFMWELAQKYRACVVFAEHRYYGKSMPFGEDTFNVPQNFGYLSVEQTLEDFSWLISSLQEKYNYAPVIAFGGSYGGMLAAWIRMKYPHLVYGALAASAPVRQFNGLTSCDIFTTITTSVFASSHKNKTCSQNIRKSWNLFKHLAATEDGKKKLNSKFIFCDPIEGNEDLNTFMEYLEYAYVNLAMANYPYASDFLSPLPGYPVRQFCAHLQMVESGDKLLDAMQMAINVYFNYTGTATCLYYKSYFDAWALQTCSQMVMPMCATSETIFRPKEWNFMEYADKCVDRFNLMPKLNDITMRYGSGSEWDVSNIIFSNGLLDPWSGGGVLETDNMNIHIIIIPDGAHQLDLRSHHPQDPPSVLEARKRESHIIGKWITEYKL